MSISFTRWLALFALTTLLTATAPAAEQVLWQIGAPDGNNAEFALAPGQSSRFKADPFYIVGQSTPADWPYAQPGPSDGWGGSRPHTFVILFGLKTAPDKAPSTLELRLLDTHSSRPPVLSIQVNGRVFEKPLPPGAGDASIHGQPSKGRPQKIEISLPAGLLQPGDNDIQITTESGCWILYDSVTLLTPPGAELAPPLSRTVLKRVSPVPALQVREGHTNQPVAVVLHHAAGPQTAQLQLQGSAPQNVQLTTGEQTIELATAAVSEPATRTLTLSIAGRPIATRSLQLKPVRPLTVYILPHSHTDIGYTDLQTAIEKKQVQNLVDGIAQARRTANYPEGARFIWNVEVAWAADLYLHRLNDQQRADFFEAVKKGQVVLNGMYLNELTGLCRPEELLQLFRYSTDLSRQTGVPIDSVMISDVPGYTWGTVTAMAQAGIRYFSTAPNYFDRIGTILREWENKPFYWVGPDGQSKVLVWIPFWGYAMSHVYDKMSLKLVEDFCTGLEKRNYPYEIAYVRWSGHGDNATPDPAICDFVKDWNAKYTSPHFIISGTGQAFRAFENRYGSQLPSVRGDWTPYWEDGAGSSALETAMNRASSDRLVQAETLFAMNTPETYPVADFADAWNKALLYSEHTWGAFCSISEPERKETREQWAIKKSYAEDADRQSRALLARALKGAVNTPTSAPPRTLEVLNTLSWPRTELLCIPASLSATGDRVTDARGRTLPSQRMASGELAILAQEIPAFGSSTIQIMPGLTTPTAGPRATAQGATLDSGKLRLRVDESTGGIVELTLDGLTQNFADTSGGEALNDYLYFKGDDLKNLQHNGRVKISVGEPGPLFASLIIESTAPGCNNLVRELRVVAGSDYVEIINLVDKARLQSSSYHDAQGKESLNFAFPFNVPNGQMLIDLPLAAMRPELDQIPSACKNWLTVGRWVQYANADAGITWVTLDAPLIQLGGLTARLLNSQTNPDVWRKEIEPSGRLYSWAMNNHWGTNYRAYQEGPTKFRFILRPHRQSGPAEATRFATAFSQPLLVRAGAGIASSQSARIADFRVAPSDVVVTALKPSQDGKATIIRLFGASGKPAQATLNWSQGSPRAVHLSDLSETNGPEVREPINIPAYGLVTVRVEP